MDYKIMSDAYVKEKNEKDDYMESAAGRESRLRAIMNTRNLESNGQKSSRKEDGGKNTERRGSKLNAKKNE
jgi:hypothetical protein